MGLVLMVIMYSLTPVSGGHFNPAISITLGILKMVEGGWLTVAIYCAVQVAAGITASFCYSTLFWRTIELVPNDGYGWISACACEALYTCMLCFVVLNTAASEGTADRQFYGIATGLVITAGHYSAGAISGGCFNPAVAIAIDAGSFRCRWCVPYAMAELAGSFVAVGLFRIVRPEEFEGLADTETIPETELKAKLVSESLGTYFLVLTVGLSVLVQSPAAAISIAAALVSMIFSLGDISEAHFNPAVTMAVYAIEQIDALTGFLYMFAQIVGAAAAALTFSLIGGSGVSYFPASEWSWYGVAIAEITFTFMLCFCVVCFTKSSVNNLSDVFGLAVGACAAAGGLAAGGVSGGWLNPAVSLGIAIGDKGASMNQAMLYSAFEMFGGVLAAAAFMMTQREPDHKRVL